MLTQAHKQLIHDLTAQRLAELRHARALAIATFGKAHPTVQRLTAELNRTRQALDEIRQLPADQQVAA